MYCKGILAVLPIILGGNWKLDIAKTGPYNCEEQRLWRDGQITCRIIAKRNGQKIEKQPSTCIRQSHAVLVSWLHIFANSYPFLRFINFDKNCITQALESSWQTYTKFGNLWTKVIIFCNFLTKVMVKFWQHCIDCIALIYFGLIKLKWCFFLANYGQ